MFPLQNFGTLEMPEILQVATAHSDGWTDLTTNKIMLAVSILLFLTAFTEIIRFRSTLIDCITIARSNVNLEHSLSSSRIRNRLLIILLPAFFSILNYYFEWPYLHILGFTAAFFTLRFLLYLSLPKKAKSNDIAKAARHVIFNFSILLITVMVALTGIFLAVKLPHQIARICFVTVAGLLYLTSFMRVAQILSYRCGTFSTILYLCALEILPVSILVVSVIVPFC